MERGRGWRGSRGGRCGRVGLGAIRGLCWDKGASQSAVLYEGETNRRGDQGVLTVDPFLTVAGKTVGRTANDVGLMI
jgi:hypothetical protein